MPNVHIYNRIFSSAATSLSPRNLKLFVPGAKDFFEAKIINAGSSSKFEQEIKEEQEERKVQMEAARLRKQAFKAKAQSFEGL